jgi:hypothetical protein
MNPRSKKVFFSIIVLSLGVIMTLTYIIISYHVVHAQVSTVDSPQTSPSSFNVTQIFNKTGLQFLNVIYQGNSTVVFRLDEESFVLPGVDSELGKGIEVLSHYGYKFDQIVTSGMGSQGNPTRFYVIMSKEIPHP